MLAFLARVCLLLAGLGICFVVLSYFLKNINKQDATATAAQLAADAKDKAVSIVVEVEATASELLAGKADDPKSSTFTSPPPADHSPSKGEPEGAGAETTTADSTTGLGMAVAAVVSSDAETKDTTTPVVVV